jgi:site-specific DNA recombinase
MVQEEAERINTEDGSRADEVRRREAAVDQQIDRLTDAVAEGVGSRALLDRLRSLEAERDELAAERDELERSSRPTVVVPPIARIRALAAEAFEGLASGSPEAGRLARRLIPRLEARPYRLCDGGSIVLRAHLTLDLAPLVPDARALEGRTGILRRELVVDLFDMPQRAAYRERVATLRSQGRTEREAAAELGLTVAAAQQASALGRLMESLGISHPYVPVAEPPEDQARMRRHKHPRYRFEPLTGYPTLEPS